MTDSETDTYEQCPLCGHREALIKRRRGGLYLECRSPCFFMGPTAATEPQALAGARRKANKRKKEAVNAAWLVLAAGLLSFPVRAQQLHMGYYAGQSTLYPYSSVFCPTDDGLGDCRSPSGYLPDSAPIPPDDKWCVWADVSSGSVMNEKWYQWHPRITPPDRVKYVGSRLCYLADKGQPKTINDLEHDNARNN